MSLLFVGYDIEKINWKFAREMLKEDGEEVDNKDDIKIIYKSIFAIADSAITILDGKKHY